MSITTNPPKNQIEEKMTTIGQASAATVDRVKDAASSMVHSAEGAAAYVGKKAEGAASSVGDGLKSLGNTIRDNSPRGGMVGDASSAVANTLESTGRYLQTEGLEGMGEDVTNLIRRNPIPAVLIGIGIGFLLAKVTTRS